VLVVLPWSDLLMLLTKVINFEQPALASELCVFILPANVETLLSVRLSELAAASRSQVGQHSNVERAIGTSLSLRHGITEVHGQNRSLVVFPSMPGTTTRRIEYGRN
jgi:hypothetical protein